MPLFAMVRIVRLVSAPIFFLNNRIIICFYKVYLFEYDREPVYRIVRVSSIMNESYLVSAGNRSLDRLRVQYFLADQ